MQLLLAAVGGLAIFSLVPLRRVSALSGAVSCAVGFAAAVRALTTGASEIWLGPWGLPIGSLRLGVDPLSALFLCILFAIGALAAIYGASWLGERRVTWVPAALNALIACVAIVFLARDSIVFLMAWEGMSIAAFVLIAVEHEKAEVRDGALWYFVFNHFGVACLFGFFALLARETGSWALPEATVAATPALLALALIGFGVKAGIAPLHVWLPAAHPVAPSHVSAMLSGVLLKAGVYGLLRTLLMLRGVPVSFGWLLVALGAFSAVLGAVNILGAADLKRSLAYSSIENVGIIVLSIGVGVVGLPIGFAAAVMHSISHAVFKSLLFMGAGSAVHATHTRRLDAMGGLAARMPATAAVFLAGAAAAAAIPGLAGFASEFFVYRSLLDALRQLRPAGQAAAAAALAALALTGGLAAAGLLRAFGIAFGGSPRSEAAAHAEEQPRGMIVPMIALATLCLVLGVFPGFTLSLIAPVLAQLGGGAVAAAPQAIVAGRIGLAFLALFGVLYLLRGRLASDATRGPTWGCGYVGATPRMQYSAESFAGPLVSVFRGALDGTSDRIEISGYRRALSWMARKSAEVRALHRPSIHQHLVYVFVALVVLISYAARLVRP